MDPRTRNSTLTDNDFLRQHVSVLNSASKISSVVAVDGVSMFQKLLATESDCYISTRDELHDYSDAGNMLTDN